MIPAQAPYEGGEPTMRKGSYSEELVRIVVPKTAQLSAMAPSTETYSSVKVVNTTSHGKRLSFTNRLSSFTGVTFVM